MSKAPLVVLLMMFALLASSCDSFVSNVEEPIDVVSDEALNEPEQIPFLITGVKAQFSETYGWAPLLGGGLSAELVFERAVPTATFPTYEDIDQGQIGFANNSVDNFYNDLGELRFFADDLVQRVKNEITFEGPDEQELKARALYIGQLYGGIARYLYAAYFGLEPTLGGGVINAGPFIPSAQMYDLSIADFDSARTTDYVEPDTYEARLLNSLTARSYLYKAHLTDNPTAAYQKAQQFAQQGLVQPDPPFQALYSVQLTNHFFFSAGPGRIQYIANENYAEFEETVILDDADADLLVEALDSARVVLYTVPIASEEDTLLFYEQALYLEQSSPIDVMTWQENALILAELALRLDNDEARALELVNSVRASHNLEPLDSIQLEGNGLDEPGQTNTIVVERAKELFVTGARLIDQRRLNLFDSIPGPWRDLPITQSERNQNTNF